MWSMLVHLSFWRHSLEETLADGDNLALAERDDTVLADRDGRA